MDLGNLILLERAAFFSLKGCDHMPRKQLFLKIHPDLFDWVQEMAKKTNRTKGNFIEYVLMLYRENSERKAAKSD